MKYMGIIEHGWNICLPAFGLAGLCVTFGWGRMRIFAVLPSARVLPWGGHREVELLFGDVQKHPPRGSACGQRDNFPTLTHQNTFP